MDDQRGSGADLTRFLNRVAVGLVAAGSVSLLWYFRAIIDSALIPPIIDEYWITVSARWIGDGLLPHRDFFLFHFSGTYYLYALAQGMVGDGMTAMKALNGAFSLLLGGTVFCWFRRYGHGRWFALGAGFLVAGPGFFLWPIITVHLPGMVALVVGCLLLFYPWRGRAQLLWVVAGVCLFLAGWSVQTAAVIAAATLAGALWFGIGDVPRRRWAPLVFAGVLIPIALWIVPMMILGQWQGFLRETVLFVVDEGYKQTGGSNDVALVSGIIDRAGREIGWAAKATFIGAAAGAVSTLWLAPLIGLWNRRAAVRALFVPAVLAPLVFLVGRHDAHHAFYLLVPGLLLLAALRDDRRPLRPLWAGLATYGAAMAFVFFLTTMPHLTMALQQGLHFDRGHSEIDSAVDVLTGLGVAADEPVAVVPWAAILYHHGVSPGHRFVYVGPAGEGYHGEREWRVLREQMDRTGTRWLAFYPASHAGKFMEGGQPAAYLVGPDLQPRFVGRRGPIELWRLDDR